MNGFIFREYLNKKVIIIIIIIVIVIVIINTTTTISREKKDERRTGNPSRVGISQIPIIYSKFVEYKNGKVPWCRIFVLR
jgi:uncharacterized alpha/beta hydrolase family protein